MVKLQGELIYLATMERDDCRKIWNDFEYDFSQMTEPLQIGHSLTKADGWFDEIQKLQGSVHIRLGIFLPDGTVIGDIALQDMDWKNRSCTIGCGLTKLEYRRKGYATDAARTMIAYAFCHLGLERISSNTLEHNIGSRRVLEKCGFVLEGRERKSTYFAGKRYDKLLYGLLREEYISNGKQE